VQCSNHPPLELTAPSSGAAAHWARPSILQENACHGCGTKQISRHVAEVSGGTPASLRRP